MDIEKLYDKLIDEPKRQREKISFELRHEYNNVKDRARIVLYIGVLGTVAVALLCIFQVIAVFSPGFYVGILFFLMLFYYQLKPRTCNQCKKPMLRQNQNDNIYYFCDNCKTKIKILIGTNG